MPRIVNEKYREFMDKGIIELIDYDIIKDVVYNGVTGINNKYIEEGQALLAVLYMTGARPSEILELTARKIRHSDSWVMVEMQALKHGLNRTVWLPYRFELNKLIWKYSTKFQKDMYLFYHYKSKIYKTIINKNGDLIRYIVTTNKLEYHVKKWFKNVTGEVITPYFLRHNRFSQLSNAGLTPEELRQIKGAKSVESVQPYLHLSSRTAKKIGGKIK